MKFRSLMPIKTNLNPIFEEIASMAINDKAKEDGRATRDKSQLPGEAFAHCPSSEKFEHLSLDQIPVHNTNPDHYHTHPSQKPKPVENILEEAQHIVEGDRQLEYGDKTECFTRIANMWAGYLGVPVNQFDVAHMMIMLKLARNVHKYKRDSMVDVAGYAYCADIMHDEILAKQSQFNGEY